MKAAAVYLRVSKSKQNPENQRPECLELCKVQRWRPRVFVETASGRRNDRRIWNDVQRRALRGEFAAVVSWSIDRMGRDFYAIQETIRDLGEAGVTVATVREPWILEMERSPLRPLLVAICGFVAEIDARRIRERITAGLATARRKGLRLGRPPILFGTALNMAYLSRTRDALSWNAIRDRLTAEGHKTKAGRPFARGTIQTAVETCIARGKK